MEPITALPLDPRNVGQDFGLEGRRRVRRSTRLWPSLRSTLSDPHSPDPRRRSGCDPTPLGRNGGDAHSKLMRWSVLSALLACLAVLAGVAAAAAPAGALINLAVEHQSTSTPCSHCDDCDKVPCPLPMTDCLQVHPSATPTLGVAAAALPGSIRDAGYLTPRDTSLSGLSPPPDPFPPRA